MRRTFLLLTAVVLVAVLLSGCSLSSLWPFASKQFTLDLDVEVKFVDEFVYPGGVEEEEEEDFKAEIVKAVEGAIKLEDLAVGGKYDKNALAEVQLDLPEDDEVELTVDEIEYTIEIELAEEDAVTGYDGLRIEEGEEEDIVTLVVHMKENRTIKVKVTVVKVEEVDAG